MIRDEDRNGAPGLKPRGRRLVWAGVLAVAGLGFGSGLPMPVAGHDGITGVFVEPDRVSPGGVIVVRGDNASTDETLRVELIAGTTRTELATAVTDGEGHFTVGVEIPVELAGGSYVIEVVGPSGIRMAAALTVDGSPIFDRENGAPVGQDEGLPALPSVRGQAAPRSVSTDAAVAGSAGGSASGVDLVPVVALLGAIGGFGLFVRWSRRPPPGRTGSAELP